MTIENNINLKKSIILCGFGHIGKSVYELLKKFHFNIIVIDSTHLSLDFPDEDLKNIVYIQGDARNDEILKKANIERAHAILALTDNDLVNISIAIDAKKLNPNILISIRMFDYGLGESLKKDLGIQEIFSATHLSAPYFIPNPSIYPRIGELDLDGKNYSLHINENNSHPSLNDALIKTSLTDGYLFIQEVLREKQTKGSWNFLSLFHYKTTFSSKFIFSFFILVLLISTLIISKEMHLDILDALYFTVTTITTVGYGDHNFSQASNFMKSYGIFLMFFGTALLASIFSLITDFLLTEKLKNFFGSHLIPKKGHHILIGAGNIGSRVAEILIKNKIPTVIIESEKIGKFSEDIRRQLPLVEGNPKNRETLLQANIQGAKSIICVTDNDVDNLSITQKAKSMNPEVVTEVSIFDKAMALKLKSLLNPEAIISSPLISANFFVGSLFFEGVLFSVTLKKSLLLICDRDKWNERISLNKEQLLLRTELSLKGKKLIIIEIPTL